MCREKAVFISTRGGHSVQFQMQSSEGEYLCRVCDVEKLMTLAEAPSGTGACFLLVAAAEIS